MSFINSVMGIFSWWRIIFWAKREIYVLIMWYVKDKGVVWRENVGEIKAWNDLTAHPCHVLLHIFSIKHLVWLSQYKTAFWILRSSYKTANSKNWILGSDWRRCVATLQGEIPVSHIRLLFQSISPSKSRLVWQAIGFNTALNAGSTNPTFLLANFL